MTTTNSIYLIRETNICNYIMIIHSPHLCGLPGLGVDHSDVEMAKVRGREMISDDNFEKWMKGEEVAMPYLTIGKGLEPVTEEEDKNIEKLEGHYEEMQMEEEVTIDGLNDALNQSLGSDGIKEESHGEEGEVMLITLEEDWDEPIARRQMSSEAKGKVGLYWTGRRA
jgi:protein OS-9